MEWYRGEAERTDKSSEERVRGLGAVSGKRVESCSARRLLRPPSAALLKPARTHTCSVPAYC